MTDLEAPLYTHLSIPHLLKSHLPIKKSTRKIHSKAQNNSQSKLWIDRDPNQHLHSGQTSQEVCMKMILEFLIVAGSLTGFLNAREESRISEKTYIDPSQVHLVEGAICVNMNDFWVQTTAVHVDSNGFYIDSFQPFDESSYSWKCPCGKRNEDYHRYCQRCGRERS